MLADDTSHYFIANAVPERQRRDVLYLLHRDLRERGATPDELALWESVSCPFPHLRYAEPVTALKDSVLIALVASGLESRLGQPCEPQFIWHWPQGPESGQPPAHFDEPPPWSDGRGYGVIAGVALTDWEPASGSIGFWMEGRFTPTRLKAGEILVMGPAAPHSSGVNRSGSIRAGVYFRWLTPDQ